MVEINKEDQEAKKALVRKEIEVLCRQPTATGIFTKIGSSLQKGMNLKIEVLSGGLTNYSYKIYLENDKTIALYAKLTFEEALWNPDKSRKYDLERTVNEYNMMKMFGEQHAELIASPLICVDVEDGDQKMKILVTEWCTNDEQLGNQLIDGIVDERIIPKLAQALATLHSTEVFDPMFNDDVRDFMFTTFNIFRERVDADVAPPIDREATRTELLCQQIGKETLHRIVENNTQNYKKRECLIHNDFHVFNIIAERKPSIASLERFGKNGSVTIVDWEMTMAGPAGRDLGQMMPFPIACALMHALNGNQDLAQNMMDFMNQLWDGYEKAMTSNVKTEQHYLKNVFSDMLGYTGWMAYLGYYSFRAHLDYLPIHDGEASDLEYVRDAVGYIGMQTLLTAFGSDEWKGQTLEELKREFRDLIRKEVDSALLVHCGRRKVRRPSTLRMSGRRVSDAPLTFPDKTRLSLSQKCSESSHSTRMSVLLGEILLEDPDESLP